MVVPKLSNAEARRLFLERHGLGPGGGGAAGNAGLLDLISRLGFVQVDSVNMVERAHHMILAARRPGYRPSQLRTLLERDRLLFEHWTHDASVIPSAFYPYWKHRFARDRVRLLSHWRDGRREGFEALFAEVLERIRTQGSCMARDVGKGETKGSTGWWDWHPSKTALEFLWRTGALSVCRREGFQKVYDLAERVIPVDVLDIDPGPDASIDWACQSALDRLGFATSGEIAAFWATVTAAEAKAWCAAQPDLVEVDIQGADGTYRRAYARPGIEAAAQHVPNPTKRVRVLSPFDPALRDRKRAERLFGFHYRIEIFVPGSKRKYGYYVFPVMEGAGLVGRVDMRRDPATEALRIDAFWPEAGVRLGRGRLDRIDRAFHDTAKLTGCGPPHYVNGWLREAAG